MASVYDKLKAGLEVTGAIGKTVGKRLVGNESPTKLSKETEKVMDEAHASPEALGKNIGSKLGRRIKGDE